MRGSRKQRKNISKQQKPLNNEDIRKYMKNIQSLKKQRMGMQDQFSQQRVISIQKESLQLERRHEYFQTQTSKIYQSENKTQISFSNDKIGVSKARKEKYKSRPKERQLLLTNERLKLHIPAQKIHNFGIFDQLPDDPHRKFKLFNQLQANESKNKRVAEKDRNRGKRIVKNLQTDKNNNSHVRQEKLEKYRNIGQDRIIIQKKVDKDV